MLNEIEIKIADYLLKYLESCGGQSIKDNYFEKLTQNGFNRFDIYRVIKALIDDFKLIRSEGADEYRLFLKPEGTKAAKIGIVKYLDEIDQDKQLDRAAKKASIKGVDTAISNSKKAIWIAVVVPIVLALLQIGFQYKYQVNNTSNDRNENGKIGTNVDFSKLPLKRADTVFIEKVKYSLKHDSVFLNEIKQLIDNDKMNN